MSSQSSSSISGVEPHRISVVWKIAAAVLFVVVLLIMIYTAFGSGPKCVDKDYSRRCVPNGAYGSDTKLDTFTDSECQRGNQICSSSSSSGSCHDSTYQSECPKSQQKCTNGIFICGS